MTFQSLVNRQLKRLRAKRRVASAHDGYALLLEELDEFKAEVWKRSRLRDRRNMASELSQLAARAQVVAEDLRLCTVPEEVPVKPAKKSRRK